MDVEESVLEKEATMYACTNGLPVSQTVEAWLACSKFIMSHLLVDEEKEKLLKLIGDS